MFKLRRGDGVKVCYRYACMDTLNIWSADIGCACSHRVCPCNVSFQYCKLTVAFGSTRNTPKQLPHGRNGQKTLHLLSCRPCSRDTIHGYLNPRNSLSRGFCSGAETHPPIHPFFVTIFCVFCPHIDIFYPPQLLVYHCYVLLQLEHAYIPAPIKTATNRMQNIPHIRTA